MKNNNLEKKEIANDNTDYEKNGILIENKKKTDIKEKLIGYSKLLHN